MSPTITRAQFDRGEKTPLDVFEDQVRGWFLEPAYAVAKLQQGGPALLLLLVPYFEMIECYLTGRESTGHSSEFARRGVQAVFPEVGEEVARIFIKEVRHAMTHELVFRLVGLHRGESDYPSFGLKDGVLWIDPWFALGRVVDHFEWYVSRLVSGDDPGLRARFEEFMSIRLARVRPSPSTGK